MVTITLNPFKLAGGLACLATIFWLGVAELLVFGTPRESVWVPCIVALLFLSLGVRRWRQTSFWAGFSLMAMVNSTFESLAVFGVIEAERMTGVWVVFGLAVAFTSGTAMLWHRSKGWLKASVTRRELERATFESENS